MIIYLQYVQHVGQKLFQREINAIGSPQLRLLLTGMLQEVLL